MVSMLGLDSADVYMNERAEFIVKATTARQNLQKRKHTGRTGKSSYVASLHGTCPGTEAAFAISWSWCDADKCDWLIVDEASRHVSTRMHVSVDARVAR